MSPSNPFLSAVPLDQLYVWVLAPHLESKDANIDYYYDFSQSIAEYTKTFNELGVDWKWQPVTINNYAKIIDTIIKESEASSKMHVIFNLCDGDEVNGTPGISVVKLLEEKGLLYTGSDEYFYDITTSKIPMKKAFDNANVPTAPWKAITAREQNIDDILDELGSPVIVKPSVSGGSMGVGVRNVVSTNETLHEQVQQMFDGYRGWQLTSDGIIAESFITGPEYTVLIVGSYDKPGKAKIYEPVERVFHPSLPDKEKFLSFDRLWEIYEEEQPMPNEGNFYEYALADKTVTEDIKRISWDAFVATKGKGYTRVDLRMDSTTGKLYVLEINAQCGLSEDEDYTSIGAILRLSGKTFTQLVVAIINDAYQRKKVAAKALKRKGSLGS
jgi:D-alanine-D-alanine ligase